MGDEQRHWTCQLKSLAMRRMKTSVILEVMGWWRTVSLRVPSNRTRQLRVVHKHEIKANERLASRQSDDGLIRLSKKRGPDRTARYRYFPDKKYTITIL